MSKLLRGQTRPGLLVLVVCYSLMLWHMQPWTTSEKQHSGNFILFFIIVPRGLTASVLNFVQRLRRTSSSLRDKRGVLSREKGTGQCKLTSVMEEWTLKRQNKTGDAYWGRVFCAGLEGCRQKFALFCFTTSLFLGCRRWRHWFCPYAVM